MSGPIAPAARQAYAEALNGLMGGILAPESGVLDAWQQYPIPFASHATTADQPAAPQPPADALADLLSGDDIHGNALRLVGRMVREGVTDAMIRSTFQILAQQVEAMRGADRAQALLGGELTRMIRGARDWQARGQTDREDQRRRESAAMDQSADSDFLTPPPRPTEAMFYGLTGEVARTAAAGREVNPVSVAAAFLSWLSAQVGRDVYLQVGDVRHPVPLFTLHVGRTAIAAKGESTGLPLRIDEAIRQSPLARLGPEQHLLGQTHAGGLSSREGLTLFVHDGYKSGRDDIPSIEDKRLWVFEPEFQNVIAQGKREGNTLSAALRDVWDGGSIKPATKGGRIWASVPHIALHGCITPFELRAGLEQKDITNGFGNRFLLIWAERTCLVPLPRATAPEAISRLARRAERVIRFALGTYPATIYTRELRLTPDAETMWCSAYRSLKRREPLGETVAALLERRAPITLRLAGLFALTDESLMIEARHLAAALAWSRYHRDSVAFVFGAEVEQTRQAIEQSDRRRKLRDYLAGRDWVIRSEILSRALGGKVTANDLNGVLQAMLADGEIEQKQEARGGAATNTKTFYRASVAREIDAKDAKHAQDGVNADPESGRTTAKDAERRTPEKDAAGVVCREVIG
ncbi:hypothetical protein CCR95_23745 [Thiocystis minor]|uniref:hypothetical protein n=1 Tax=Thiocystis minor TaxID=61597 RepID=UPI0019131467|nr:hypothetical protein [Thiocystis minor]MBK5966998.1 hypothetical protein [Thiocystis minor]